MPGDHSCFLSEKYINIPFRLKARDDVEFELCLRLRSWVEEIIVMALPGSKEKLSNALGVCVYELFDNTIRYSILDTEVRIIVEKRDHELFVQVTNTTDRKNCLRLEEQIQEMSHHTPLEYYLARMRQPPREDGGGGLGLARVYHDCDARISLWSVQEGDGLKVTVLAALPLS